MVQVMGGQELKKSIMIVEDEQVFHDLYTEMLEDTDYEIIRAYDGDEALEKLEEEKPELIILDMLLDMVTGDTLFLYLKGMPDCVDIPIIILSNSKKRDYKNLLKMDPRIVFLDKTVTSERLIGEIKKKIG
jgi:CheY-like chemotaxis protein